jgi:hypothetical protein
MYPLWRGRSEPKVERGGDSSWGRGRGRARTRFLPRSRLRPSPGVGRGGDRLPRPRLRPSPGVGRGGDHLPRPRRGPSPGVGRGGDLLLRPRPKVGRGGVSCCAWGWTLAVVSLTLAGGTAVGAGQAALFSCQVGQWKGELTAVTSALSTKERA